MPELPEVEVTRLGLVPGIVGRRVTGVAVRNGSLRQPVPIHLADVLLGRELLAIGRRGKYLLLDFGQGWLLVHLGMSGSLRLLATDVPVAKHDHVDLEFGQAVLRYRDPRRFGLVLWHDRAAGPVEDHPLLAPLGLEPLTDGLTGAWLYGATRGRSAPIKQVLMDAHTLVGVGNIYASESLFRAGIAPHIPARQLTLAQCQRLAAAIKETLAAALAAGGSTLRDFIQSDGSSGYFQMQHYVYGRAGEACRLCGSTILSDRLGNRSTFFCPRCQGA